MRQVLPDPTGSNRAQYLGLAAELDRNGLVPMHLQIADVLRHRILAGELLPGSRLPSTRDLAASLGVHRRSVVQAFGRLETEGLVVAGVGQGTFVCSAPRTNEHPSARSFPPRTDPGDAFAWGGLVPGGVPRDEDLREFLLRPAPPPDTVGFTGAAPDPEHFPAEEFREILDEVLRAEGARALDYAPPAGLPSLREWIAARLTARRIPTDPGRVLIVNGSQQGLDLVARTLLGPESRVLVEEPSYSNGFRLFQSHGAAIEGVRTDEQGLLPGRLAAALRRGPASLLYVMPIFQNPTGAVLDPERIHPILELADRHRLPILEDHFDAELVYHGDDPIPIKARDERDQVILLGTFSKILFPGLRLGWLVLPAPLVERVIQIKQMADLSSGLLVQHALDRYCRRGLLDAHLARVRAVNTERLRVLLETLEEQMPPGVHWTQPRGGMTVWLSLPPEVDSLALLETARRGGVEYSPGALFFPNGGGGQHLRLCYVREPEPRIRLGIARLAAAIREEMARRREDPVRPFV